MDESENLFADVLNMLDQNLPPQQLKDVVVKSGKVERVYRGKFVSDSPMSKATNTPRSKENEQTDKSAAAALRRGHRVTSPPVAGKAVNIKPVPKTHTPSSVPSKRATPSSTTPVAKTASQPLQDSKKTDFKVPYVPSSYQVSSAGKKPATPSAKPDIEKQRRVISMLTAPARESKTETELLKEIQDNFESDEQSLQTILSEEYTKPASRSQQHRLSEERAFSLPQQLRTPTNVTPASSRPRAASTRSRRDSTDESSMMRRLSSSFRQSMEKTSQRLSMTPTSIKSKLFGGRESITPVKQDMSYNNANVDRVHDGGSSKTFDEKLEELCDVLNLAPKEELSAILTQTGGNVQRAISVAVRHYKY